jgi:Mn-dependent DtxR family transcriptional regulator
MGEEDQSTKKYEAVLMELTALGLIEFKDDEHFRVTDKGLDLAREIMNKLPLSDRILIAMAAVDLWRENK